MGGGRVVLLLERDPELGDGLSADELAVATTALPAQAAFLEAGNWAPGAEASQPGHLGYLILDGLLVRRVRVGGGSSVELLGRGDLLRPWQEDASSFCTASWEVLEETEIAILGPNLAQHLGKWPAILANLIARGISRSRSVAAESAIASIVGIEERLLILLWHIAERWGEARADGVHVTVHLPHRLLAEMLGARRPSVTTALAELQEAGRLNSAASNGHWVLSGEAPVDPGLSLGSR
jgi:CRP/FNR family transcriptional regulator, cyclic AMP receptor protein